MPDNLIDAIKIKQSFEKQPLLTARTIKLWLRLIPVHFFITYHKSYDHVKPNVLDAAQWEMFKR